MKKIDTKNNQIYFYFPSEIYKIFKPKKIVNEILNQTVHDGTNDILGYLTDIDFANDLIGKIGTNKNKQRLLSENDVTLISNTIEKAIIKFNKVLDLGRDQVTFFIFPWFPSITESKKFGGVGATATYYNTIHLYIDLKSYTPDSIVETLIHELNHIYVYKKYPSLDFTILDRLIIEGLAENFREYLLKGKPFPWSVNMSEDEIKMALIKIKPYLSSKKHNDYINIFYGNKNFKRWTGYTVGYFLVKKFINKNKKIKWKELMDMESKNFVA